MSPQAHSAISTRLGLDHWGSPNQAGPSMPTFASSAFTGPVGLSITTKASEAPTTGTIAGTKNSVRYTPAPRRTEPTTHAANIA